jgi:riboflavin transporter
MKFSVRMMTYTALLLVLVIVIQQFKSISIFITGPIVNAVLIIATLLVGFAAGIVIAVISPIVAYLVNPAPIMQLMPLMVPFIILGNLVIVIAAHYFKQRQLWLGLGFGAVVKALVMWVGVYVVNVVLLGVTLPDKMRLPVILSFSVFQLITALLGILLAYLIYPRLKNTKLN